MGLNYSYNSKKYQRKQSLLTKAAWERGDFDFMRKKEKRICKRADCKITFAVNPSDQKVYCSQSCAAVVNNKLFRKRSATPRSKCLNCAQETAYYARKYCSIKCQMSYKYDSYIKKWKKGEITGLDRTLGVVSDQVKRYLRKKYQDKCCLCGWSEINIKTGRVPLVADHIDGNWQNNKEENLRLLCPNCDALTPTFGSLNKGRGRPNRIKVSKRARLSIQIHSA